MTSVVGSPPLDILIRTSGVKRLSDYLPWQASLFRSSLRGWTASDQYSFRAQRILRYNFLQRIGPTSVYGTFYRRAEQRLPGLVWALVMRRIVNALGADQSPGLLLFLNLILVTPCRALPQK